MPKRLNISYTFPKFQLYFKRLLVAPSHNEYFYVGSSEVAYNKESIRINISTGKLSETKSNRYINSLWKPET